MLELVSTCQVVCHVDLDAEDHVLQGHMRACGMGGGCQNRRCVFEVKFDKEEKDVCNKHTYSMI